MNLPREFSRRIAVSLAVLGIMAGGVSAITRPAEPTQAAWTDSESVEATVTIAWSTGGFAKNTANSYTNFASYPGRREGIFGTGPQVNATSTRQFAQNSPTSGSDVNREYRQSEDENLDGAAPNFEIWTPSNRNNTRVDSCVEAASPQSIANTTGTGRNCNFSAVPAQTRASSSGPSAQLGVAGFYANPSSNFYDRILIVEGSGIQTSAECRPDGTATAQDPKATWSAQDGSKIGILTTDTILRSAPTEAYKLASPATNSIVTGWIKPNVRTSITNEGAVWVYYKILSRQFVAPGYALSDISVQVSHYNPNTRQRVGTSELILARSECGVTMPSAPRMPITDPWMPTGDVPTQIPANVTEGITSSSPAPMPNPQTGAVLWPQRRVPSIATRLSPLRGPAIDEHALTTVSPIDDATGVEVTTSAPPDGGDSDDDEDGATAGPASSTSAGTGGHGTSDVIADGGSEATSAAPTTTASEVPTAPSEPGRLPADAERCGTLEIAGEDIDAVTAGECDTTQRRSAMRALEGYIADGEQDSRWKGFTSDDPDSDGWRWAAIDQRTGQVVYVP